MINGTVFPQCAQVAISAFTAEQLEAMIGAALKRAAAELREALLPRTRRDNLGHGWRSLQDFLGVGRKNAEKIASDERFANCIFFVDNETAPIFLKEELLEALKEEGVKLRRARRYLTEEEVEQAYSEANSKKDAAKYVKERGEAVKAERAVSDKERKRLALERLKALTDKNGDFKEYVRSKQGDL